MTKRPYMSLSVKLEACLYALGFNPAFDEIEFDHYPALELREKVYVASSTAAKWIIVDGISRSLLHDKSGSFYTIPDANNAAYIVPRTKADHKRKTNGPGGEKRITTRGGDHGDAAHLRRLTAKHDSHLVRMSSKSVADIIMESRDKMLAAADREIARCFKPKRKIASRPFPKRGKKRGR